MDWALTSKPGEECRRMHLVKPRKIETRKETVDGSVEDLRDENHAEVV